MFRDKSLSSVDKKQILLAFFIHTRLIRKGHDISTRDILYVYEIKGKKTWLSFFLMYRKCSKKEHGTKNGNI